MAAKVRWSIDADYLTFCNCDWGCPCNFNARPNQGNCHGVGAWRIREGTFNGTRLDGTVCAIAYFFPGLIEQGNGTMRAYVDRRATKEQVKALEAILYGRQGSGLFEVFANLCTTRLPLLVTDIDMAIDDVRARLKIPDVMEATTDALSYPDGMIIRPTFNLPHGIEFKEGLAVNAKSWWIRDETMLAHHSNVYGVVSKVRFTEKGCVG